MGGCKPAGGFPLSILGQSDETELLRRLYAGAAQRGADWQGFLTLLARLTRAQTAALLIEGATGPQLFSTGPIELPPPEALRRMRADRVYAQTELDGARAPLRALRIKTPEGQAWLFLHHALSEFRATDGAQLARLAPHLTQALDIWRGLGSERAEAQEAQGLARSLGAGWLWFEATGRVSGSDAQARALIDNAPGLRLSATGWLEFADPTKARAFRAAFDRALNGIQPQSLTLHRADGLHLALLPGWHPHGPFLEPVLRAALRRAPAAGALDPALWAQGLGLSRSEARLAVLLCDGQSLAEAAQNLGWTPETARSASKRIFAQSGTRGQSDLIRRMLTGAEWFGQGFDLPPDGR